MTTSKVIPVTIVPIFNPIIPGLSAPPRANRVKSVFVI